MPRLQEEMDRISAAFEEGREQGRREAVAGVVALLKRALKRLDKTRAMLERKGRRSRTLERFGAMEELRVAVNAIERGDWKEGGDETRPSPSLEEE
jgi:hypothetical protein